jgi:DNA (cytosine-5)-methyltransferase 1
MSRPRLLDLFCGAGGAAKGYEAAGFEVVGVDVEPQDHYPFEFVRADAIRLLSDLAENGEPWPGAPWFDAVHASPPCQDHIRGGGHKRPGNGWMLAASRYYLERQPRPWVIENVPGAPMRTDFKLCGCMFGLTLPGMQLIRERWFETSWHGFDLRAACHHEGVAVSVVGHGTTSYARDKLGRCPSTDEYRALMGMDWCNRDELSLAIPPAYAEYIGRQMLDHLAAVTP